MGVATYAIVIVSTHLLLNSTSCVSAGAALPRWSHSEVDGDWSNNVLAPLHNALSTRSTTLISLQEREPATNAVERSLSLFVALLGSSRPARRNATAGEPHIQLVGSDSRRWTLADADSVLPLAALNAGFARLETVLQRPLYAFRLKIAAEAQSAQSPYAVWDVSDGEITLNERVLDGIGALPPGLRGMLSSFSGALLSGIGGAASGAEQGDEGRGVLLRVFRTAAASALAVAVGSQIPTWFCIACPIALGLLAPFAFNAGLGAAADAICEHYSLPAQDCNDLFYGAFALALVLSLASVFPIVAVCRLRECARQM